MIECYYKWCIHHEREGPFCDSPENICCAPDESLKLFARLRELEMMNAMNNLKIEYKI